MRLRLCKHSLAGMALVWMTGCTAIPEYGQSGLPEFVNPSWAMVAPASENTSIAEYWTLLNDPLLSEYVERAIVNNRDLAVASARLAQARAGVRAARAGYLPQITAGGNGSQDFGQFALDDPQFAVSIDASWEADLFGRIGFDVAANREQLRAAGFALADLQRLIVGQVAQTTISARALAIQLAIARETLANQDENLQIARWRLQAGLVSSLDVEQARSQRAQTAATIPALERDLAASANTISTLIAEAPGPVLAALSEAAEIPNPPYEVGYPAPAQVLRNRPDVRQAEANLLADGARIGVARAQLYPLVQLSGNISTATAGASGLFDIITGGLIASVRQLIFDGGRTRAQIESAEAQAEASLAAWEQAILFALEEVETSAVASQAAHTRVELFAEALDAATNAATLARSQYQAGLVDFPTLLVAESQLLTARNSFAASQAERANAFVRLTQALGGGWQANESGSLDQEGEGSDE